MRWRFWLGSELEETGRPITEVIRAHERAYTLDPLAPNVVFNLAVDLYVAGHKERARTLAEELAGLTPGGDDSLRLRAWFADAEGRWDDSIRWLSRATKTAPDNPAPLVDLGD